MRKDRGYVARFVLLLSLVVLSGGFLHAQASQTIPLGGTESIQAPVAAWDPPHITIAAQGSTIVLGWFYENDSIKKYAVWRSELPYFNIGAGQGTSLGLLNWGAGGIGAAFQFVDSGSTGCFYAGGSPYGCQTQSPTVQVVGNTAHNYFWIVRAGDASAWQFDNRVGEFDFGLTPGS
jgi:hypothetical protein